MLVHDRVIIDSTGFFLFFFFAKLFIVQLHSVEQSVEAARKAAQCFSHVSTWTNAMQRKPDDSGNAVMFFMCCAGWSQHRDLDLLFMKEAG